MIKSYSELYYKIGLWFSGALALLAIIVLPFALARWDSIISFLMCAGLMFVACAAAYQETLTRPVHYWAASISAACSIVWVAVVNPIMLLFYSIGLIGLADKSHWLFWCETACFVTVLLTLFIH